MIQLLCTGWPLLLCQIWYAVHRKGLCLMQVIGSLSDWLSPLAD